MQNKNYNKIQKEDRLQANLPTSKLSNSAGFTLLFASLIGSLVFTIGIAILNISIKQISLATSGRESQQSFYSADAGIECALFLDRGAGDTNCRSGFFGVASSTESSPSDGITVCDQDYFTYKQSPSPSQACSGNPVTIDIKRTGSSVTSTFSITDNPDTDICFSVSVTKKPNPINPNDLSDINSVIEARGYNTCNTNGAVYERAIKSYNY